MRSALAVLPALSALSWVLVGCTLSNDATQDKQCTPSCAATESCRRGTCVDTQDAAADGNKDQGVAASSDGRCSDGEPGCNGAAECTIEGLKGACAKGRPACTAAGSCSCEQITAPRAETCDGADSDCDGELDAFDEDAQAACEAGQHCDGERCVDNLWDAGGPLDQSTLPAPTITAILPANGPVDGGRLGSIPVVLQGQNFSSGMKVYLDGGQAIISAVTVGSASSASFKMPKCPYSWPPDLPSMVSVTAHVGNQVSNAVDFQYSLSKPMGADFTGAVLTAAPTAFGGHPSEPIAAKVFVKGLTDFKATAPYGLIVQVGLGLPGEEPDKDYSFKWSNAQFISDGDKYSSPVDAKYDVYEGVVVPPLTQTYDIAFRFSRDGGQTWRYADLTEDANYLPADAAKLSVQDGPSS